MGIRHGIAFQVIWIATELQILGSIVGADLGVNTPLVAADAQPMLQQVFDVGNLSFTVSWLVELSFSWASKKCIYNKIQA